ncbi:hypothetical protein PV396_44740 [Streptomyces sp. ME02-8801-2C]|uniref:hypothetical protein n=1 Tax=Streptomyces sp. ME02-8801-2C TaxID=3028680 RepID=UPI0029B3E741|nr:hypothetical protein [Streptomyces sp. ME02-8801-2C]MDX3458951.1 hypothetical protein [Streptomyces sp. ME02-8801-2C]
MSGYRSKDGNTYNHIHFIDANVGPISAEIGYASRDEVQDVAAYFNIVEHIVNPQNVYDANNNFVRSQVQDYYLNESWLREYEGRRFGPFEYETDPEKIRAYYSSGELDFTYIYES